MTENTPLPKKRIEYIDALRGFTMILVVFSHVEAKSFGFADPTFINSLFLSFRMPLFFFVSGFIAYKASMQWNLATWWQMSKKKMLIQLIPTFVFGLIYAYAYAGTDILEFVTLNNKLGYWFTIALFEIFIIVYTANTLLYNNDPKVHRRRMMVALIILSAGLFLAKIVLKSVPALNEAGNWFTLHHTFNYFQYFAFGYICTMYKEEFNRMLENRFVPAVIITLFAALFYTKVCCIGELASGGVWKMVDIMFEAVLGYLGLLIVYNTFKTYQSSFTADKKVGRALQFIGRRTLDIYLLHYFFLPHLPQLGNMLADGKNATLELFLGLLLSLIVTGMCLAVSGILRTSPLLGKWLFGVKDKQ